jgi:hypothetical protein
VQCFANSMQKKFEMSMIGELSYFIGLQVKQSSARIFISQEKYLIEMLKKFQMEDSLLVAEPDYLPDLEVFYFQPCLYPMKYFHPKGMYTLPCGGVQRGVTPFTGSEGAIPLVGGFGGEAPEAKIAL